jgi:hypothetical protein
MMNHLVHCTVSIERAKVRRIPVYPPLSEKELDIVQYFFEKVPLFRFFPGDNGYAPEFPYAV